MGKSKYGINLALIAVLCLVFAILNQLMLVVLVCAYSILLEKNEWLNKQVLLTLMAMLCFLLIYFVFGKTFGLFAGFIDLIGADGADTIRDVGSYILKSIRFIFILIYAFLGVMVGMGKELKISFMNKLVGKISE